MSFPTDISSILERVDQISPRKYARTRNFQNGAVTRLSPYISRGVISTQFVFNQFLEKGFEIKSVEKFYQELAWRDYWQRKWQALGNGINSDLSAPFYEPKHDQIPSAILSSSTGINAMDVALDELYDTGYMHNHMRMYVAGTICPIGKSHWHLPAKWMYYHLLDADWASNALSWQWVSGTSRNRIYIANQENINKYWNDTQRNTFLDRPYAELPPQEIPSELQKTESLQLKTELSSHRGIEINLSLPTLVYNNYNLDPFWKAEQEANRILLLEPEHFAQYPMSSKTIDFILDLSKNIEGIQLFVGSFSELEAALGESLIYFKEHPLNDHYRGVEEERDWMFPEVTAATGSFFSYWKKCLKSLNA
ncbi:MAG: FAD-binding domain-containing protein [Crocinitomicaceae bacterium]